MIFERISEFVYRFLNPHSGVTATDEELAIIVEALGYYDTQLHRLQEDFHNPVDKKIIRIHRLKSKILRSLEP